MHLRVSMIQEDIHFEVQIKYIKMELDYLSI